MVLKEIIRSIYLLGTNVFPAVGLSSCEPFCIPLSTSISRGGFCDPAP